MKATMYPAITLGILFVNFSCLLAFVVPQLEPIFPKKLPLPTIILIFLSHGVRFWWWSVPLAVASIPFTWRRIPSRLKGWVWGQLYRVWVFGPLLKGLALCNFFFNLSLMLGAGIPLLEAFDIVLPLASSSLLAEKLRAAKVLMAQGGRFSDGLRDSFFPSVVASAMRQGESTGHLDVYTGRVAQFLRARARARLQTLATFLEPALLLAGGGMLLLLGAGIFLPIYGQMSHGGH
jgi:type II secretory pathway component PulF